MYVFLFPYERNCEKYGRVYILKLVTIGQVLSITFFEVRISHLLCNVVSFKAMKNSSSHFDSLETCESQNLTNDGIRNRLNIFIYCQLHHNTIDDSCDTLSPSDFLTIFILTKLIALFEEIINVLNVDIKSISWLSLVRKFLKQRHLFCKTFSREGDRINNDLQNTFTTGNPD